MFIRTFVLDLDPTAKLVDRDGIHKIKANSVRQPRVGVLVDQMKNLGELTREIVLSDVKGKRHWELDKDGFFTVASTRVHLDSILLESST